MTPYRGRHYSATKPLASSLKRLRLFCPLRNNPTLAPTSLVFVLVLCIRNQNSFRQHSRRLSVLSRSYGYGLYYRWVQAALQAANRAAHVVASGNGSAVVCNGATLAHTRYAASDQRCKAFQDFLCCCIPRRPYVIFGCTLLLADPLPPTPPP